ncbi:APC family permease [Thiotrichales bacterium 19S9-12]|nr:APC family permease [Thiotrichales bacterium 19S9-11]MCF6811300.1 APC family permease [Thiotrichales bacterium 19S9-12]
MKGKQSLKVLGIFSLTMLSISAILNLRNIPFMASLGITSIFFYALAGLLFLLPSAFICASLASRFPLHGGIYTWVRLAFGERAGFLTIWMEWFNNVIGFPATLSMIVATLAYTVSPDLVNDRYLLFSVMMLVFWGCTFFNLLQIKISVKLNIIGALCGTILPGFLIIILGLFWSFSGQPLAVSFDHLMIIPSLDSSVWVFFVGAVSGYAGMQITAFHAKDVKDPQKTFPKAIFLSMILIFSLSVLATMALAVVVPKERLSIISGVIEGFSIFFNQFGLSFLTPILALCIALGGIASLSAWMLGPARALQQAAFEGLLPKSLAKTNTHGMPVIILLAQGGIGSILALAFLWLPSAESAFWLLIALTAQFTVLMFLMMFLSAIKLSFANSKDRPKGFYLSRPLIILMALIGSSCCSIAFYVGLFPPELGEKDLDKEHYVVMMLVIDFLIICAPFIIKHLYQKLSMSKKLKLIKI